MAVDSGRWLAERNIQQREETAAVVQANVTARRTKGGGGKGGGGKGAGLSAWLGQHKQ